MAKQYNPWTGFMEDNATKANDASPVVGKKYAINGKEFKVLKVQGENVSTKWDDGVVRILPVSYFEKVKSLDKAIRYVDSVSPDARDVYNILAQALQNSTNPSKVSELISKAQGKLLEMAAKSK